MTSSASSPETSPRVLSAERPLSPHLQVYRPQITSILALFHRLTGVGLAGGLVLLVVWLICLALGREPYALLMGYLTTTVGKVLLFGWTWAVFYHFCSGVRHLLWTAGWCLSIARVWQTGILALLISGGLTLGVWAKALGLLERLV